MRHCISVLSMTVAAALLVGCSSDSQISNNAALAEGTRLPAAWQRLAPLGWALPAAKKGPFLYVAANYDNEILIYPENGYHQSPVGTITSGVSVPYGLSVDLSGNLYVSNQSPPTVTVYPAGSTQPSVTYSEGLVHPLYSVVDQYGDLFVGNRGASRGCDKAGTIVEYKAGSQNPYQTLNMPGREVDGMDFDQQGDLYAAWTGCSRGGGWGGVEKFAPGSTQGEPLDISVRKPQGLLVDKKGNILVVASGPSTVELYRPGSHRPSLRLKLPDGGLPVQLAITSDESRLFVSSWNQGSIWVTGYPLSRSSTWTSEDSVSGTPLGIALSNGQTF
ncbi:MAG TPA: hypothetical protein VKR56_06500 [Candidatus Cybelea sp.]|nr:hypothetical protein [Candidatus Cybelea sp.]